MNAVDQIKERVAIEMVQDFIAGKINNQSDPGLRQALIHIANKVARKIVSAESPFEIEEMEFDSLLNEMANEWMQTQSKLKDCRMRRATEEEMAYVEGIKRATEEQKSVNHDFFRWEAIKERAIQRLEKSMTDVDGLFYASGRVIRRKNDEVASNQKVASLATN